ncbi:hypothetical protein ADICEAN_02153 [Cesiribacter andamanensis AMV16]|uniref:Uncharacterized protein n=1 Tax=Cesiribacter andamanensis AMV16 TaxID=1279009 RepID=M7N671_9BACT|nr:hypothetical protein ADICEAN_02153 [Cesiribacter andamanensis AMV16]
MLGLDLEALDKGGKFFYRPGRTPAQKFAGILHHFPKVHALLVGRYHNFIDGGIAYAPAGQVNDAAEGLLVLLVYHKAQVAQQILDLLALVEGEAPVDAVLDVHAPQGFFQGSALAVGAVQNGKIRILHALVVLQLKDGRGHNLGFLAIGGGLEHLYLFALHIGRPDGFFQLGPVMGNHGIGRVHNVLGRAVVLLQLYDAQVRKVLLKVEDVLDIGAPEGVNALGIIAHYADVAVYRGQFFGNEVLHHVGILKLIHQNVAEAVLVLVQHIGMVPEQHGSIKEQVIKVHGPGAKAALGVGLVDLAHAGLAGHHVFFGIQGVAQVFPIANKAVFGARYAVEAHIGLVHGRVHILLLYNSLQQ